MELKKIDMPTQKVELISRKATVTMRPMTVKESKIILVAKQSGVQDDIIEATVNVLRQCVSSTDVDITSLPIYDIVWLYIQLKAFSVSNKIKFSFNDEHEKEISLELDLGKIQKPEIPKERNTNCIISSDLIISFKDLPVGIFVSPEFKEAMSTSNEDKVWSRMLLGGIDSITMGENTVSAASIVPDKLSEWIDTMPAKLFDEFQKFNETAPEIKHTIEYKDSAGKDQKFVLATLPDFFLL